MKLTRKDKLAIIGLLCAGSRLSNGGFNLGQIGEAFSGSCKEACENWDKRYAQAKVAIRKLQLPPF